MKKIIIIIFLLASMCIIPSKHFGQSYTLFPDDTISMTGLMEDLETLTIQQQNISNNSITLAWQKVSESVPPVWETNVCDNVLCYGTLVNGGVMNPIAPGDFTFLLMHVTPHVNYGTAIIRYSVWDVNTPSIKDTLTYILTVNAPTGIEAVEASSIEIYPTLINNYITVKSNHKEPLNYFIATTDGHVVKYGILNNSSSGIDCSGISDGMYILSVAGKNYKSRNEKIVIKH